MKKEIIAQMTEVVRDLWAEFGQCGYLMSDFEIDKKTLENYEGDFIWSVRHTGTNLTRIGIGEFVKWMRDNEADRYGLVASVDTDLPAIDSKYYFIYRRGSNCMDRIAKTEATAEYQRAVRVAVDAFNLLYPELRVKSKHVDVHAGDFLYLMEQVRFAKSISNTTLMECLKRLQSWQRRADDHRIVLSRDFAPHSFIFSEYRGGNPIVCGGIIYNNGRWSIHT